MKILGTAALAFLTLLGSCATPARPAADQAPHARAAAAVVDRAPAVTGPSYTGDVDADGRADRVALTIGGRLLVRRAAGGQIVRGLPRGSKLVGLADLGASLAIVTSAPAAEGSPGRVWAVRTVDGNRLRRLPTRDHELIGTEPGFDVSWLNDARALYTGSLDPLERGHDRRSVQARRWRLEDGRLISQPQGTYCWNTATDPAPRPCRDGEDLGPDVGSRGDLPALFPGADGATVGPGGATSDGGVTFSLQRGTPPGSDESPNVDLVATEGGHTDREAVPAGWVPALYRQWVDVGIGAVPVVLTSQEGGDSDTWRVWVWRDGNLSALATDGPVPLGGGFTADGAHAIASWLAADGRVYTRVGTDIEGRYDVYGWNVGPDDPATLVAHDLGTVCLDLYATPVRYGTC